MLAGSYLQVTSPTFQQLTTDNPGLVSSNACTTGNSVLTLSSPAVPVWNSYCNPTEHCLFNTG